LPGGLKSVLWCLAIFSWAGVVVSPSALSSSIRGIISKGFPSTTCTACCGHPSLRARYSRQARVSAGRAEDGGCVRCLSIIPLWDVASAVAHTTIPQGGETRRLWWLGWSHDCSHRVHGRGGSLAFCALVRGTSWNLPLPPCFLGLGAHGVGGRGPTSCSG